MNPTPPRQMMLRVSFDADQIGNQLVWSVTDDIPAEHNAYKHTGPYAGSLHFQKGDLLNFEVVATGRVATFETFRVTDATLITVPAPYQTPSATPSPFDEQHATFDMDGFAPSVCQTSALDPTLRTCTAHCQQQLTVVQPLGVWKFSLVMTVIVVRKTSSGLLEDAARVFSFDPIAIIGPGDGN